jgi:acetaldehyde dehydrogenase
MEQRVAAAVVGSGNIGSDLLMKLRRSPVVEVRYMVGVDPTSRGLRLASDLGVEASAGGVDFLLDLPNPPALVFEATSAAVHRSNAPRYAAAGIRVVDLTPAAVGPFVVPVVNLPQHLDTPNVNMVTCGGQATIPIVHAIASAAPVSYAEIVSSVASVSAGPGTRQNIDEFTRTTRAAIEQVAGVPRAKAIVILNPADPPPIMRNTVYCAIPRGADEDAVERSVFAMAAEVAGYVPGYRLLAPPQFDDDRSDPARRRVAVFLEVEGDGAFLPNYSGNLDIMTAAATRVGELLASEILGVTR